MPVTRGWAELARRLAVPETYRKITFLFVAAMGLVSFTNLDKFGETVDESFAEQRSNYYQGYVSYLWNQKRLISFEDFLNETNYNGPLAYFEYGAMWPVLHSSVTTFLKNQFKVPRFPGLHVPYVLLFYGSLIAFALLARRLLGWRGAFLSTVLLSLYPNLAHHVHNNPKDVPAMGFMILATYTFVLAAEKNQRRYAAACAWFFASAITTKMDCAVFLPAFVLGWLAYLRGEKRGMPPSEWLKGRLSPVLCFACLLPFFAVIMWPSIWFDWGRVLRAAKHFSGRFHNFEGLYLGQLYLSTKYPRHYIPVQLTMVTPVVVLALFGAGVWGLCFAERYRLHLDRWKVLIGAMFLFPILPRLLPGSALYNGIRHVFPAIPPMILIAASGAERGLRWMEGRNWQLPALGAQAAALLWILSETVSFYPHGNAYFNEIARFFWPNRVHTMFESDYYGSSQLQAVRWVNQNAAAGASVCVPIDGHTVWSYEKRRDLKWNCDKVDYLVLYGKFFHEIHKPTNLQKWRADSMRLAHTVSRQGIDIARVYERPPKVVGALDPASPRP